LLRWTINLGDKVEKEEQLEPQQLLEQIILIAETAMKMESILWMKWMT
jgi:hypothetical protein